MSEGKKDSKRKPQLNSIIRALKLLEIIKTGTDKKHKLTQEELLKLMKKMDGSCTLKTIRTDLRNLMEAINPIIDPEEYASHPEEYRILYDGIEEGRKRISGVSYQHEFSNDELDLIIELVKGNNGISKDHAEKLGQKLKALGSMYYTYSSDSIKTIPEHTNVDITFLRQNLWAINIAILQKKQITFTFNGYGQDGKLHPFRERSYQVNPYYVVSYEHKYYLLATHGKYTDVHIYRLDLMTDIQLTETPREPIQDIPELEHSNAKEYMKRHINMYYDEPRTITLRVKNNLQGYTAIHDQFGDAYTFKRKVDEEQDEIEVIASGDAVIEFAIRKMNLVEIVRPQALRKKVLERAQSLIKKYQ